MKKACMSTKKNQHDRSNKKCVCGGHNTNNGDRTRVKKKISKLRKKQRKEKIWLTVS